MVFMLFMAVLFVSIHAPKGTNLKEDTPSRGGERKRNLKHGNDAVVTLGASKNPSKVTTQYGNRF